MLVKKQALGWAGERSQIRQHNKMPNYASCAQHTMPTCLCRGLIHTALHPRTNTCFTQGSLARTHTAHVVVPQDDSVPQAHLRVAAKALSGAARTQSTSWSRKTTPCHRRISASPPKRRLAQHAHRARRGPARRLSATGASPRCAKHRARPHRTRRRLRARVAHTGSGVHRPRSAPAATDSHTHPLQGAARPPGAARMR